MEQCLLLYAKFTSILPLEFAIPLIWPFDVCLIEESRKYELTRVPEAGGRLNKKDGLTRYGDSHFKDKTS